MNFAIGAAFVVTVLFGLLATFAIWSRGYSRSRTLSFFSFIIFSPIAAGMIALSLGWAVPCVRGLTIPEGDLDVLGSKLVEDFAIYVLVDTGNEPRYCSLPWDMKTATSLQEAKNTPNQGIRMKVNATDKKQHNFDSSLHFDPQFYPLPQIKEMPDKPVQVEAPLQYTPGVSDQ